MKFKTQHIRVKHGAYDLHRDGKTTYKTTTGRTGQITVTDEIVHDTVAAAKAVLGNISSAN